MEIVRSYQKKRLQVKPSKSWNIFMIVLLWLVLPFKMIKNFIKTEIQLFKIPKQLKTLTNLSGGKFDYKAALSHMDIWKTTTFSSFVTKTNNNEIDGKNHNTSNMTALNAFYLFLLGQTVEGKAVLYKEPPTNGLLMAMHTTGQLSNGYKYNEHGGLVHDIKSTNASTLANVNLAVHAATNEPIQDRFDILIQEVINNNFGLLEYEEPDNDVAKEAWLEQPVGRRKLKSVNAMFQPDPSLTGENALTILASLKLAEVQRGSLDAKNAYYKLLWKNGYAFLSAFPTAGVISKSAMFSLYVLSKRSTGKEKILWKFAMRRLQALAVNTDHDMLFTGMLFDAYPELLKKDENKMRLLYFNRKLNSVDSKYNLEYLGNYTMIKNVVNLMLEQT